MHFSKGSLFLFFLPRAVICMGYPKHSCFKGSYSTLPVLGVFLSCSILILFLGCREEGERYVHSAFVYSRSWRPTTYQPTYVCTDSKDLEVVKMRFENILPDRPKR